MQTIKTLPVVLVAAAFCLTTTPLAQAQGNVSIQVEVSWSPYGLSERGWGPSYWGDFQASGAIADSGGAQYGPWYPDSGLMLYGAAGEIRILLDNQGGWVVESGTGAYAYLEGGGTYTGVSYVVHDPWRGETYVIEFDLAGTAAIIDNVQPEADLVVTSVSDRTVQLSAAGSQDPDGAIVRYDFDFDGDGSYDYSSIYPGVQYTYAADGTYVIRVRVTDDRGGTDIAFVSVAVQAPPPPEEEKPGKGGGKGKNKK
jgi:hypothetical protein